MTEDEYANLVGRTVMVGNVHATICDYNRFNRPPFTWEYAIDGAKAFGWRENFYVPPTRERVEQVVREICLFRDVISGTDAVLNLLGGAKPDNGG